MVWLKRQIRGTDFQWLEGRSKRPVIKVKTEKKRNILGRGGITGQVKEEKYQ